MKEPLEKAIYPLSPKKMEGGACQDVHFVSSFAGSELLRIRFFRRQSRYAILSIDRDAQDLMQGGLSRRIGTTCHLKAL